MAVAEEEQTEQREKGSSTSSGSRTALKAAATAAATGAATIAVRKALSHDGRGEDAGGSSEDEKRPSAGKGAGSILSTAASSAWESASDVVLPMAEEAVAAAGRYLAEKSPEIVKERLVPRFIDAFNEAR